MKALHVLSSAFWLMILVIACNTTPADNAAGKENSDKKENGEAAAKETAKESSLEGESFPETGGFKGRNANHVFYIEVSEAGVTGFVRYKDSKKEHKIVGKKTSPFDFEAEEMNEDGEKVAKLRGKMGDDETSAALDYTEANSGNSFRVDIKR